MSLNASLEPYNGSRSQKSHNNIRRMLSVVYFEGFFNRFKGGFEKHCTRASLRSDTVEDLIRICVEGSSLEDVDARESVAAGLAEAKDQEGQTTGVGHPRGMWLQWRIVHKTLSHEMFSLKPLKHLI